MQELISISINKEELLKMCRERINDLIREVDMEKVFWDTNELKKRTCMSWNTIQTTFFFDSRFVKRKVGSKWYFPVKETREFLELWLMEQPIDPQR